MRQSRLLCRRDEYQARRRRFGQVVRYHPRMCTQWCLDIPSRLNDGSRMNGDVHVWFCESLGVKFPGATHPAGCGRSGLSIHIW